MHLVLGKWETWMTYQSRRVVLRLSPVAIIERGTGFRIELVGRPVDRGVGVETLEPRAGSGGERHRYERGGTKQKTLNRKEEFHERLGSRRKRMR